MPRPAKGYFNQAGQQIPGTHDPIGRFKDSGALIRWAHSQGQKGLELYAKGAIDIGHTVHDMCEMDLKGRSVDDIDWFMEKNLSDYAQRKLAVKAYAAFRSWRDQVSIRPVAQEIPLVSELYQYGGTPDVIAVIGNGLGLVDFKTSNGGRVYEDMLLAMAAHGQLWLENNPDKPLTAGYHLIILPKDGSGFGHYHYPDLEAYWKMFDLLLQAYQLDKLCSDRAALEGKPVVLPRRNRTETSPPSVAPAMAPIRPQRPASIPYAPGVQLSMAEILRAYAHVKG